MIEVEGNLFESHRATHCYHFPSNLAYLILEIKEFYSLPQQPPFKNKNKGKNPVKIRNKGKIKKHL